MLEVNGENGKSRRQVTFTVTTLAAIVAGTLSVSAMYWGNTATIGRLQADVQTLKARMERQDTNIHELQVQVALLAEKHREAEREKK